MYKIKTFLLACSLLSLLASCNDSETHMLTPVEQALIIYADQTVDSLSFYTFDSWTATSQVDWITIDGDSHQDFVYDNTKCYLCKAYLNAQPNTTGKTRKGFVLVKSYDYSYSAPFVQLGLLRVLHPLYTVDTWLDEQSRIPEVAHYELIDSAHWTEDSLCFTVENDWGLVFPDGAPSWLQLGKETDKGKYKVVDLALEPNTDKQNERVAKLLLTSRGVSNEIIVRQLPDKRTEEEEDE